MALSLNSANLMDQLWLSWTPLEAYGSLRQHLAALGRLRQADNIRCVTMLILHLDTPRYEPQDQQMVPLRGLARTNRVQKETFHVTRLRYAISLLCHVCGVIISILNNTH